MNPVIVAGSANIALAEAIAEKLGIGICRTVLYRFPDTELHAEIEIEDTVRNGDVYVIQPTGPAVDPHLMELLFLADACRRAGASHITAVVPYFGYARQDRRATGREAVGGRLAADMLRVAGFERVVAVDLHTASLEGFFSMPLEHLSAISLLANAIEDLTTTKTVIVAPDLGAVKLAERYAELLRRPIAIAHKTRISGEEVKVHRIVGDVAGSAPLIVDDMISTGATIETAAKALIAAGSEPGTHIQIRGFLRVGMPEFENHFRIAHRKAVFIRDASAQYEGIVVKAEVFRVEKDNLPYSWFHLLRMLR